MAIHLIIDGYNLIRQSDAFLRQERVSLESGRQALIQKLSNYKKIKHHKITVIFDGASVLSDFAEPYYEAGIRICFSPQSRSADDIIKEWAEKERSQAIIVTSDTAIIAHAQRFGCGLISSPDFYEKLFQAERMAGNLTAQRDDEEKKPAHKRWMTYKKGPSKKAPKKSRHQNKRLEKL
jgi:predicted RNA-binding protein with PIN domain